MYIEVWNFYNLFIIYINKTWIGPGIKNKRVFDWNLIFLQSVLQKTPVLKSCLKDWNGYE